MAARQTPWQAGNHIGHTPIWSNADYRFKPEDVTGPELLKGAGYKTGRIGKWVMGGEETSGFPLT